MKDKVLARDKIGGCKYTVSIRGNQLICVVVGYGYRAQDVQDLKDPEFNYDAEALRNKLVSLERRMRDLSRLSDKLAKENGLTATAPVEPAAPVAKTKVPKNEDIISKLMEAV